jgi:hypothetical protein
MKLEDKSSNDLLKSLEAEAAKALNELKESQGNLDKINGRLRFILAVIHIIKQR